MTEQRVSELEDTPRHVNHPVHRIVKEKMKNNSNGPLLSSLGKCNLGSFALQESNLRTWEVHIMPFYIREGSPTLFICLVVNDALSQYALVMSPDILPSPGSLPRDDFIHTQGC